MGLNDRTQNCVECEFMKMYDYGNMIYYCDHTDRIDDMGKLGADYLPKTSPVWCPLKEKIVQEILNAIQGFRMERCHIR